MRVRESDRKRRIILLRVQIISTASRGTDFDCARSSTLVEDGEIREPCLSALRLLLCLLSSDFCSADAVAATTQIREGLPALPVTSLSTEQTAAKARSAQACPASTAQYTCALERCAALGPMPAERPSLVPAAASTLSRATRLTDSIVSHNARSKRECHTTHSVARAVTTGHQR